MDNWADARKEWRKAPEITQILTKSNKLLVRLTPRRGAGPRVAAMRRNEWGALVGGNYSKLVLKLVSKWLSAEWEAMMDEKLTAFNSKAEQIKLAFNKYQRYTFSSPFPNGLRGGTAKVHGYSALM